MTTPEPSVSPSSNDPSGTPSAKPSAYHLRAATPADVPAVHRLIRALAEFEELAHLLVATEADLAVALFGPGARVECLLACPGSPAPSGSASAVVEPVAFALFFQNYSTFLGRAGLYLEDLFVEPEHRRRGVARLLMTALAQLAVSRGCGRFEWSVLDWNQRAIDFYEGLGAVLMNDWRIVRVTGPALQALASQAGAAPAFP